MGIFSFFSKSKKQTKPVENPAKSPETTIDYSKAVELAKILTNHDETAVRDITLLVEDYPVFYEKHQDWCDKMNFDGDVLLTFAYWLVGYDTKCKYGAYIDWKEETGDIIWNLEPAIANLGYPLNVHEIEFSEEEPTGEALQVINGHFAKQGYTLVGLDTQSDCYHLFIAKTGDFDRIAALGHEIKFTFFNEYM